MSAAAAPDGTVATVHVPLAGRAYDILVGRGLLGQAGARIAALGARAAAIVCDGHTGPLYGEALAASLRRSGLRAAIVQVAPGEASKSYAERLFEFVSIDQLDKEAANIALLVPAEKKA